MSGRSDAGRPVFLLSTLFFLVSLSVANTSSSAVAQPEIARVFGATSAAVGWVTFGFAGAFAVGTVVYGGLARRLGSSWSLTTGGLLLVVGSLGAVVAPSLGFLVAARILQGAGAGAIPTMSFTIIAERLDGLRRARAMGVHIAAVGTGHALGPLMGGLLVDAWTWRAAVGVAVLTLPGVLLIPRLHCSVGDRAQRMDIVGVALTTMTLGSALWLVNRIPVHGFDSWTFVVSAVLATCTLVALIHVRLVPDGLIPKHVLLDSSFRGLIAVGAVGMAIFLGIIAGLPLAMSAIRPLSATQLGLMLLPMAAVVALVSPQNGIVIACLGRRRTTAAALVALIAGALATAVAVPTASHQLVATTLLPVGVGFGLLNAPLAGEVAELFQGTDRSSALGTYNAGFFFGGAVGGALTTTLVEVRLDRWPVDLSGFSLAMGILVVLGIAAVMRLRPSR